MIDTHTHLYSEEFNEDRTEIIKRAINKGITKFYLPAIDSKKNKKNGFEIFGKHDFVLGEDVQTDLLMKMKI